MVLTVLIAGLLGAVSAIFVVRELRRNQMRLARYWCQKWVVGFPSQRARVRWALTRPWLVYLVPWPPLILLTGPALLVNGYPYGLLVVGGLVVGYGGILLNVWSGWIDVRFGAFQSLMVFSAEKEIAKVMDTAEVERILVREAALPIPVFQKAVVDRLARLGTAGSIASLEGLSVAWNRSLREVARARLDRLQATVDLAEVRDVGALKWLFAQYFLANIAADKVYHSQEGPLQLGEIEAAIDAIVDSQIAQRMSYPAVWCLRCNARGEEMRSYLWRWVQCKRCGGSRHLLAGVREVVGVIGDLSGPTLTGDVYRLPLWDDRMQEAIYADVEVVEVVGGGGIDYDWAVSAVVEMLVNRSQKFQKGIEVRLVDGPGLSANSMHLLKVVEKKGRP